MRSPAEIEALVARGRAAAEVLMTDALRCERPTGRTTRDDRGNTVPETAPVWTGKGKVQSHQSYPSQPDAGGRTSALAIFEVHIPAGDPFMFHVDDEFVVEDSHDVLLPGRRFRYRTDPAKTYRTARRFNCEEVGR